MDPTRFDALTRALFGLSGHLPSRRALLGALGVGLVSVHGTSPLATEAKKRRKKRRRKKKKCLFGQRRCSDKRCHGCCSDADCGGNACESGVCRDCPRNERLCRGGCIPEDSCCTDSECTAGRACLDGACVCGPNQRLCDGFCIPGDACCTSDDCGGAPCERGRCLCADGQRDCHGRCIPDDACCTSPDCAPCETCQNDRCVSFCPAGQTCQGGECGCASGERLCRGECIPETSCCRSSDCSACERCEDEVCVDACPAGLTCQDGVCSCPSGQQLCDDTCIPENACCPACPDEQICVDGTCVIGQGTCPAGADNCVTPPSRCDRGGTICNCNQSTAGETRCGEGPVLPDSVCGQCANDDDCQQLYPQVLGVFCARGGPACACAADQGRCIAPCPA